MFPVERRGDEADDEEEEEERQSAHHAHDRRRRRAQARRRRAANSWQRGCGDEGRRNFMMQSLKEQVLKFASGADFQSCTLKYSAVT